MKHFSKGFFLLILVVFLLIPSSAFAATLSLSPSSLSINNGSTFDVQIVLNTEGVNTSGTDVQLRFDKDKVNIVDITNGTIYDQYVGKNINNAEGIATLSGLASSTTALYKGTGTFATLRLRAVGAGTASVSFISTPGNKNDTNVANFDTQEEALSGVTNGSYTITGSSSSNTSTGTSTNTNTTTATTKGGLPVTSTSLPLIILVATSMLLVAGGVYFYKHFRQTPPTPLQ